MNRGQTCAAIKSPLSDARHAVADGDGGQTCAAIKSRIPDARHAVGDSDGS